ncbi:MAG: sensor domain-containing phosphodiesterase, partial [Burkholderiales bacterium]
SVFRVGDLMRGIYGERAGEFDIHFYDGNGMSNGTLMYDSAPGSQPRSRFILTRHLEIDGREWTMRIASLPAMESRIDSKQPDWIAGGGIFVSLLITLITWLLVSGRRRSIQLALDLNHELIASKQALQDLYGDLEATMQAIPDLLFDLGENGEYFNIWAHDPDLLAAQKEMLLGHTVDEMLPRDAANTVMAALRDAAESGYSHGQVIRISLPQGERWFELSVAAKADRSVHGKRFMMLSRDITERKLSEKARDRLARAHRFLSECDGLLVRSGNEQELLSEICRLSVETGGYLMAWVGYAEQDDAKSVRVVALSGYEEGYLENVRISWADDELGQGPGGVAIRTGATVFHQDFQNDPGSAPWREAITRRGVRSVIAIPLVVDNRILGIFSAYSAEPNAFVPEEVTLLETLAHDLSYGIETLRGRAAQRAAQLSLERESLKNRTLLRNASDGIHILDAEGNLIEASDSFCAMLGYERSEAIGMNVSRWEAGLDSTELAGAFKALFARPVGEHVRTQIETRHKRKDGSIFDAEVSYMLLELDGKPVSFCSSRDITERKHAEEMLRINASVFDNSQEAIVITDADNAIMDVNPAFTRITGYAREEVVGKTPGLLSSGRQDKAFYAEMWQSLKQQGTWRGEIWNRRKSGEIYAELLSISLICDDKGKVQRHVGVFSDINYLKEHEAELSRIAHYDALTGIPNRTLLADRMRQAIAKAARDQNMLAVCYLDLDGFKSVNDTLGHEAGDQVLIEMAHRIGNTIRGGDTVARLGGDEFVVLLSGLEQGEECVTTLERLLATIARPVSVKNNALVLGASIGVSLYPLDDEDPDTLLRHADQAMYVAKQSGKNRFHIYDPEMDLRAHSHNEFVGSVRRGLEQGEFELFYQPKIDLRTQELIGAEALIRWRHPERGLLLPAEFLHPIENSEIDIDMGDWVITSALEQLDKWRRGGLDIEVSVNISAHHLESSRFVEKLRQQLAKYPGIPHGRLQIEVLETAALADLVRVNEVIGACRKFGVSFALDDFGTGYSSLAYLRNLPVDVLKIDQSFVRNMLEDRGDMAIVQGIVALAGTFNRQTVAEGIETMEHYQALLDMGCDAGQGFGIARPMPADELVNWRISQIAFDGDTPKGHL